jgi:hypothetical protein
LKAEDGSLLLILLLIANFFSRNNCFATLSPATAAETVEDLDPRSSAPGVEGTVLSEEPDDEAPLCFFACPNSVLRQREAKFKEQTVSPRL